jgi:hypothetical protein
MGRRVGKPARDVIAADTVPVEIGSFHVPDSFDVASAGNDEIRAAYAAWERRCRDWYASHELRPVAELLADDAAMADVPFNPYEEMRNGTL